jgi:hypothetical protein
MTNCAWQNEMLAASDVALLGKDTAHTVGKMLDVALRRRMDGVAVRRQPRDKDRRTLSPNVAFAVVGQKTKFRKRIIASVLWRIRLGVYQGYTNDDSGGEKAGVETLWRAGLKKVSSVFGSGRKGENGRDSPSLLHLQRSLTSFPKFHESLLIARRRRRVCLAEDGGQLPRRGNHRGDDLERYDLGRQCDYGERPIDFSL